LRSWTRNRILTAAGIITVTLATCLAVFVGVFSDMLINRYAKEKIEQVFTDAFPGYALRIGSIHYNIVKNYTECLAVSLSAADSSLLCTAESFTVSEIGWRQLIFRQALSPAVVKRSLVTANGVILQLPASRFEVSFTRMRISIPDSELTANAAVMTFDKTRYQLRCGLLHAVVADSEVSAEGIELLPLTTDEDFFAASMFRRTRVRMTVSQCYIKHVSVLALLQGGTLSAGLIDIVKPRIDLLVNRDKLSDPIPRRPLMPAEALAGLGKSISLDTIAVHDGSFIYGERLEEKGKTGIITFDSVQLGIIGLNTAPKHTAVIRGSGRLMNAGLMSVVMKIPMTPGAFSLSYHGTLTAMDCTTLNRFLETAEHTRITSGNLHHAAFDVRVARGQSTGSVKVIYNDLYITLLDKKTGSKNGLGDILATLAANIIKIRGSNLPDKEGAVTMGKVHYTREPMDTFMNIAWFSLRSGTGDVVGF
jgi:hypothetical protein